MWRTSRWHIFTHASLHLRKLGIQGLQPNELYRKVVDEYSFPEDCICRYECTLTEAELAGEEISEIGLYDEDGDIVCIKNFTRKGKDDDVEQTYVLDDIF